MYLQSFLFSCSTLRLVYTENFSNTLALFTSHFNKSSLLDRRRMETRSVLITIIHIKLLCGFASSESFVAEAIEKILNECFVEHSSNVDFIYCGRNESEQLDLIDDLLERISGKIALKVLSRKELTPWKKTRLQTSSLIIFDSLHTYKKNVRKIKWQNNQRLRHKHLVYVPKAKAKEISQELLANGFEVDSVGFLANESEDSIDLISSFMYTPDKCRSNQFVRINKYTRNSSSWENSQFFPKKYQNFHKCPLVIGSFRFASASEATPGDSELLPIDGTDESVKAYKVLSKFFNFSPMSQPFLTQDDMMKSSVDLLVRIDMCRGDKNFICSVTVYMNRITFAVPFGELYTPMEKMFLMFDDELWLAIAITLIITILIIQIIKRLPMKVQMFVFGRSIQTPTMNLLSIFLIGAQYKVPGRNFARFLLVLFLVWSLIIRTCYQSMLFKYLQANPRRPGVRNLDELVASKFTIFSPFETFKTEFELPEISKWVRKINVRGFTDIFV